MKKIKAGFATRDISPEKPVPGRLGLNHMIYPHHDISAKALALSNGKGTYLIIVCEIVGLTKSVNQKIRKIITDKTGIPFQNIVITGTHTHASPWVWDLQDEEARKQGFEVLDRDWMNKVIGNTVDAGIKAAQNMSAYQIKFGVAETTGIVSNRVLPVTRWSICADDELRNAPEGIVDRNVRTISFHDSNDKPVFVFANLACHPSAYGGGKTTKVSPDFPYISENLLKEKYGENTTLAYWQGCAGNINSGKYVAEGSDEEAKTIGTNFFNSVNEAIKKSGRISGDNSTFEYIYEKFTLPVGKFVNNPGKARERFKNVCSEMKSQKNIDNESVFKWRRILKQLDVSLLSAGKEMEIELQLFRFGNTDILFVPGEWFVQMYKNLAALNNKRNLIVTTLNNFDLLYIPDEKSMPNKDWYGVKTDMRSLGDDSAIRLFEKAVEILA